MSRLIRDVVPSDRNRPVHFPGIERFNSSTIYFVTVCTHRRQRLLANQNANDLLRAIWSESRDFLIGRYVLMPDHLHLFCVPTLETERPLAEWVSYWKSRTAQHWPAKVEKLWQRDFWDTQLRHHESYSAKWDYIRNNPVRAGLVADSEAWPYQGEMNIINWG